MSRLGPLPVPDATFDALYPSEVRARSQLHWTPVAIAMRAAELFDLGPEHRILDVGCGVGKACLVGMLASPVAWWGIEREPEQVEIATRAARELGLASRARFLCGEAWELDWSQFDGLYFYNPFPPRPEAHPNAFVRYGAFLDGVVRAEERLAMLRAGTRIVTYHGFGGDMPDGFELRARVASGNDELQLWQKA